MKTQIAIIAIDPYHFFVTKQIIESKLKIPVKIKTCCGRTEIPELINSNKKNCIIDGPTLTAQQLISTLNKRRVSRLNTEITIIALNES